MPRKWEIAAPIIKKYIDENGDQYLNELSNELGISPYVIKTAAEKQGFSEHILSGMSPTQKAERNKKLSKAVRDQVSSGKFQKSHKYDDEWKASVKKGLESFKNDPQRQINSYKKRDATCRDKYGNDYRHQFQEKAKHTKKERYGSEGYNNPLKQKQTKLEKYGDPNYNNRSKAFDTFQQKYGGYGNASKELLRKSQQTCLKKYGVTTNLISKDPKLNGHDTIIKRFGSDKARYEYVIQKGKDTKRRKYGNEYWSNPDKAANTMMKKYGVSSYLKTRDARISKSNYYQDNFYSLIKSIFKNSKIIKEFKSDKYPWFCDFYIENLDLYIEYNFHWSHGPHPFDAQNEKDIKLFNVYSKRLKAGKSSYTQVIKTWCIDDVKKLNAAIENKLSYVVVYGNSYREMNVYAYVGGVYSESKGTWFETQLNLSRETS